MDDEVRLQTNQELRGFLLMLLRRTDRRDERVLCLSGLAKVELSGTPSERCLGAVAELRAEVGRRRGQSDYDDELVDAVALLASAVVRKTSGHHVPEASEARRRLLAPRLWTGSPWRRLLVRSLITHAVLAMETGHHSALNSSSEAVGHANHLRGGFRAVLMAEALDVRSRVLGDLGRHTEAAMAEVQAISLRAAEACSLRVT